MKNSILIIDDDVDICTLLDRYLSSNGFEVQTSFTGSKGVSMLKDRAFDVVLSDFRLPDIDGIALIKKLKATRSSAQVIVITGYSDVKLAIQSVRSGAFEYVTKPIQPEEILNTIREAIEAKIDQQNITPSELPEPVDKQKHKPSKASEKGSKTSYVVGSSSIAKELQENIDLISPTDMSVIILGETGTGKEVAAKSIHNNSQRKDKPFVAVDCGALPKELASSELFGHVKGAFTGALADKKGSFELADGGTLFLDEIGNLSYDNQIKLLRVIQERKIKQLGGTKDIDIDVRIIVATNEDLAESIKKEGEFREDLYYRLNEFKIQLAPLRERKSDLMQFAEFFLQQANDQLNRSVEGFSQEVIERLKNYYWHGNLRELKNVVKRATLLTKGQYIELAALPQEIIHPTFIPQTTTEIDQNITDLKSVTEQAERKAIEEVLRKTNYNKTKTAEILNIDRKTLYNKITAYGIDG